MDCGELMKDLVRQGCYPGIYTRGKVFRAHVNSCGNYWADARTPLVAMRKAIRLWEKAGKPMDGLAVDPKRGK